MDLGTREERCMPRPSRRFDVDDAGLGDAPGVAVRGEVDISVVEPLEAAIDAEIRDSVGAFIIDLSDLEFIESSGLHVLLRARGLLSREDRQLAVVCPFGPVRRVLELAGLSEQFVLYPSREEALAALVPAD
jgi:anti-sigma B factor antagonist